MKRRIYLKNVEEDLKEQLKDPKFRRAYEYECALVELAQKIAEFRDAYHLKQAELAAKLGVSQQFISQLETGRSKNLTLQTLLKVAASLGRGVHITFPKSPRPTLKIQ
ncbi:MAG: helix-turn-helix transcriptional regulator [Elusimicrobia bacterium]|nr:helix-turn-helix transcriptional regulator [Elusimicrobiota bacterium]